MARTLPDRCPSKHLGFTDIGLCHQRHVPQHLGTQLSVLVTDHHGSATTAISTADGMAVQRRKMTPYGQTRTPAGSWPGDRGFLGGSQDATDLTHLGAREYDPDLGRFISVDPVMDLANPQQIHGYTYANNNPVTLSDPDGLKPLDSCQPFCDGGNTPDHGPTPTGSPAAPSVQIAPSTPPIENDPWVGPDGKDLPLPVKNQAEFKENYTKAYNFNTKHYAGVGNKYKWSVQAMSLFQACQQTAGCMGSDLSKDYLWWNATSKLETGEIMPFGGGIPPAGAITPSGQIKGKSNGAPGCHSFVPETAVLMADGTSKPIKDIGLGDVVQASDPASGESSARAVTALISGEGEKQLVDITIAAPDRPDTTGKVTATTEHPFWLADRGQWVNAGDVLPGNSLLTAAGTYVQVLAVRHWSQRQTVKNLTVEGIHTYHVLAGPAPVLVHNSTCTRYGAALSAAEAANPLMESLRTTGKLPSNYVTKAQAGAAGWEPGKAVGNKVPGGQIGGHIFENADNLLPNAAGRTWYEADVGISNMMKRSKQPGTRLVYSSDGLAYVTADHYRSFYQLPNWK